MPSNSATICSAVLSAAMTELDETAKTTARPALATIFRTFMSSLQRVRDLDFAAKTPRAPRFDLLHFLASLASWRQKLFPRRLSPPQLRIDKTIQFAAI